jgi:hypothetical protein
LNFKSKERSGFLKHFNSADFSHENRSIQICCGIFTPSQSGTMITATPDKAHPRQMGGQALSLLHCTSLLKFISRKRNSPKKLNYTGMLRDFFSHAAIYNDRHRSPRDAMADSTKITEYLSI